MNNINRKRRRTTTGLINERCNELEVTDGVINNLIPLNTAGTNQLGTSTTPWKDVYVTNTHFNGDLDISANIIPNVTNFSNLGNPTHYMNNAYINNAFINNEYLVTTEIVNNPLVELNASDLQAVNSGLILDEYTTTTATISSIAFVQSSKTFTLTCSTSLASFAIGQTIHIDASSVTTATWVNNQQLTITGISGSIITATGIVDHADYLNTSDTGTIRLVNFSFTGKDTTGKYQLVTGLTTKPNGSTNPLTANGNLYVGTLNSAGAVNAASASITGNVQSSTLNASTSVTTNQIIPYSGSVLNSTANNLVIGNNGNTSNVQISYAPTIAGGIAGVTSSLMGLGNSQGGWAMALDTSYNIGVARNLTSAGLLQSNGGLTTAGANTVNISTDTATSNINIGSGNGAKTIIIGTNTAGAQTTIYGTLTIYNGTTNYTYGVITLGTGSYGSQIRGNGNNQMFIASDGLAAGNTYGGQVNIGYKNTNYPNFIVYSGGTGILTVTNNATPASSSVAIAGGLYLPTSSGTASPLNYYEEYTQSSCTFFSNGTGTGSTTSIVSIKFVTIGKQCTMHIPAFTLTTLSSSTSIQCNGGIPSRLYPPADTIFSVRVTNGGGSEPGWLWISNSVGSITLFPDTATGDNFNNSATCGLYKDITVTYLLL